MKKQPHFASFGLQMLAENTQKSWEPNKLGLIPGHRLNWCWFSKNNLCQARLRNFAVVFRFWHQSNMQMSEWPYKLEQSDLEFLALFNYLGIRKKRTQHRHIYSSIFTDLEKVWKKYAGVWLRKIIQSFAKNRLNMRTNTWADHEMSDWDTNETNYNVVFTPKREGA